MDCSRMLVHPDAVLDLVCKDRAVDDLDCGRRAGMAAKNRDEVLRALGRLQGSGLLEGTWRGPWQWGGFW